MRPDSSALPFLVVHGALFWKVLLGVFCLLALALVTYVRWLDRRARIRRSEAAPAEGDAVRRGIVRGGFLEAGGQKIELASAPKDGFADGDEVFAIGRLVAVPPSGEGEGYRDGGVGWRLEPRANGGQLLLSSTRAPVIGAIGIIATLLLSGLAGYWILHAIGSSAAKRGRR
jgi:hypothetical protein